MKSSTVKQKPVPKRTYAMSGKEARDAAAFSKKKKHATFNELQNTGEIRVPNSVSGKDLTKSFKSNNSEVLNHSKNMTNKSPRTSKYANISHKHSNGANNWQKFLQDSGNGIKRPVQKSTHSEKFSSFSHALIIKPEVEMTKVVAMDCEMVGIGDGGRESIIARVSLVNSYGDCIYDKFVKPREKVTDYRTFVSGVREEDLATGSDFDTVQKEVASIVRGRILVGHSIKNDLEVLYLKHPHAQIRDTAIFFRKLGCPTPSLKTLAQQYLGVSIQHGEHSSVQDAKAAVQLYNLYRKEWERGRNRNLNRIDSVHKRPKYVLDNT